MLYWSTHVYTQKKTLTHVSNSTQSSNTGTILQDKQNVTWNLKFTTQKSHDLNRSQ